MDRKGSSAWIKVALLSAALLAISACPTYLPAAWEWLQDTSYYAPGYTEAAFRSIREGPPEAEVIRRLGTPLRTRKARPYIEWIYGPTSLRIADDGGLYVNSSSPLACTIVTADGEATITSVSGRYLDLDEQAQVGRSLAEIEAEFGKPLKVLHQPAVRMLTDSGTRVSGGYYVRMIGLDAAGRVNSISASFYQD